MSIERISLKDQQDFNRWLIGLLEDRGIPYGIGGSLAAMHYSEPRYTIDVDLMIATTQSSLKALIEAIEHDGLYVDPFETVLEFNLPAALPISIVDALRGTKADIYVSRGHGLDASAMSRRVKRLLFANPPLDAWILSPEDVILYKLDYFRQSDGHATKHPADIANMLATIGETIDQDYLTAWTRTLGIESLWRKIVDSAAG